MDKNMNKKEKNIFYIFYIIIIFLILMICKQYLLNSYHLRIINFMMINMILALTLGLTNGFTGVFSLGHGAFMAIGAYVSSILTLAVDKKVFMLSSLPSWLINLEAPFIPSLVLGGIVSMFFAFLIGIVVLRLKGHYLALSTLAFMGIIKGFLTNAGDWTRGARGISNIYPYTNTIGIYICLVITLYIVYRLINSHFGRAMKAIREDETAAISFGINSFYYKTLIFCIGAFGAGIAGGLWAHFVTVIDPRSFSYKMTFDIISMIIIGGSGSISGCIIGAVLITTLPEILRGLESQSMIFGYSLPPLFGISQIVLSIAVIVILIYRPGGIMGYKEIILPNPAKIFKSKKSKKYLT